MFDTGLVSLQLNDTFTNFISRCKSSLHRTSGFYFYKNNNDFYVACLKYAVNYLKELDACVLLPFFDDVCDNVEIYEILNFDEDYGSLNCVSVFDNGKNNKLNISAFCESCNVELIEKLYYILYYIWMKWTMICFFVRKVKMVNFEEDIVKSFCCSCFYDKYIFLTNDKKKLDKTVINDCFYEPFCYHFQN